MSSRFSPWTLRAGDFNLPGWHVSSNVGFELFFEFLRLSPSYELASREAQGELSVEETTMLPADFDDVRRTFDLLGNVQQTLYRNWWRERGLKAFGNPNTQPNLHKLSILPGGKQVEVSDVIPSLAKYLEDSRPDEGQPGALLLAVPLGSRKSEVLRQISALLDEHESVAPTHAKPVLALQGERLRAKVLFNGIRLLWFRAAKPTWELWRLGAKAGISPTYSKLLDPDAPRKVKDEDEKVNRLTMSKVTYRALVKFESIAENAARGRFPTDQLVQQVAFNYPKLAKTIQRKNAWEKKEKARLLKIAEERTARRKTI
ncbi:hypothetical protein [Polaromonas sp.]|uniref:hypothetical protein n=1 Tax=Polaromonas sp. TaxID=1869339 RepID=UPI0013BBA151|nr:hypothetical protein [Polaromonas sp.]NDP64574.1 hypothetical protein [Polaromonas sp.]